MNKFQIAVVAVGALLVLGYLTVTVGSGVVVTETRPVEDVSNVSLRGQGQLILTQGDQKSLRIEAEDNIINRIDTRISGNTLVLDFEKGLFNTVIPRKGIKYYLTLSNPREVTISGSGSIDAANLTVERFRVQINGSGDGYINNLVADELVTDVNGSGKFVVSGDVRKQRIEVSGSANYRAIDLVSDIAEVRISGSGKTELNVRSELDVRISGSGNVRYKGNPRITQRISGSGKIRNID